MPTTAKSNAKSTTRRKPIQSAQERPAAQVVSFPLFAPKPRQTAPQEVKVMTCECAKDAVSVRLMPDPDAMTRIMDETFGPQGWEYRYYYMNGVTFCGSGVLNPITGTYPRKDEKAPAGKFRLRDPKDWETTGSFIASVAKWGAGSDVLRLPPIVLSADQVDIDPVQKPGKRPNDPPTVVGYRLHHALTVDKLLRAEDGHIIGVQLLQGERKVVWQAE